MCKFQSFCYKKDAIEGVCVFEFLGRNSENAKKDRLAFFDDTYHWTSRDWNTGETSSLSLERIIEYDKYLIKLNWPERYFKFTYGDPLTR